MRIYKIFKHIHRVFISILYPPSKQGKEEKNYKIFKDCSYVDDGIVYRKKNKDEKI
jgi:hypothetical protein